MSSSDHLEPPSVAERPSGRSLLPPLKMNAFKQQKPLGQQTGQMKELPSRKSILKNPQVVSVQPRIEQMTDEAGKSVYVIDVPPDIPGEDNPEQVRAIVHVSACEGLTYT